MTLNVQQLIKTYPQFNFGPLDLQLKDGECIAMLGHNGAGKSTFFQMITGQIDPTSGEVTLFGQKLLPETYEIKRRIGYLPQHLELPEWVSATEILQYACKLYELPESEVTAMIDFWAITPYRKSALASCSHGMRKRVGLALANIHQPDFLILDEPFSGLDIAHIKSLEHLIKQRSKQQKTTILSTHIIPYAAELCDRALLINAGQTQELSDWQNADFRRRIDLAEKMIFSGKDS